VTADIKEKLCISTSVVLSTFALFITLKDLVYAMKKYVSVLNVELSRHFLKRNKEPSMYHINYEYHFTTSFC
jgi:hypothetical protein